ncbi:MAG: dihydrolipoamide acetyltransferase family protein [Kofleriaceae bacterium]
MPSLGADMEAGTLLEWRVAVGDHVARGSVVGLIETQKATMELESFAEGVVEVLLVEPGAKVPVGTVLARLGSAVSTTPSPRTAAPEPAPTVIAQPPTSAARIRSSPSARRKARELDIDLSTIRGSGPHGAIILRDVVVPAVRDVVVPAVRDAVVPAVRDAVPAARDAAPAPPATKPPRRVPSVTGPMRDAIGAAMSRSKREIPHFYLSHTISMKRPLAWLADINHSLPIQERILPGALLLRAVATALWDFPELNGFYIDGTYRASEEVHLATAISLRTGGLVAPAILHADSITLPELMRELQDLVVRARTGHLKSSELTSATITVTSLGERGCETVFPVINPPQVAIVGFGAIATRPWVEGDAIVAHPTIVATLAADHRVCDGHRGGLFLSALDHLLQEPAKL